MYTRLCYYSHPLLSHPSQLPAPASALSLCMCVNPLLRPSEFNQGHLYDREFETLHWCLVGLLGMTQ